MKDYFYTIKRTKMKRNFEISTAVKIQVEVIRPEDGGSIVLRNDGKKIVPVLELSTTP
jgi:hypothetical protein